ncbi:MAG TPA: proline dehydrogenase family protein [Myxococcota bacterium]|jgi:RHH-type proline utilization regulon transcriptional repressor/proline dehydrogenase/delta 1-pyrroline-5-carboxylate dehydrogenase
MTSPAALEARVQAIGRDLFERSRGEAPGVFSSAYWEGQLLAWAMRDPAFKVDLFRFVDAFPMLRTREQVARHVDEMLLREGRELPAAIAAALRATTARLTGGVAQAALRKNVEAMAARFIVGRDARDTLPALRRLHDAGVGFTVDLLGEATLSESEGEAYLARYRDLVENLPSQVAAWPADAVIDRAPRANVSIKLSALDSQLDAVDHAGSVERLLRRALPLFMEGRRRGTFLNVDLEQWATHGIAYDFLERVALAPELRDWPQLGVVVQAYLRDADAIALRLRALARRRGAPITIRLVKGAYWDTETVLADQNGWASPVWRTKAETDACYERLSRALLESHADTPPALGSHNLRSLAHAFAVAEELRVPPDAYEVQMLYGMAEPERAAVRATGRRVRVYAPVGELLPGMAYLVRRLLENTANVGFLRLSHHERVDVAALLAAPALERAAASAPESAQRMRRGDLATPFEGCPPTDFADPPQRAAFAAAVDAALRAAPIDVPVAISGLPPRARETFERACPSDTGRIVSRVSLASAADADAAVAAAARAWPAWRDRPLAARAALLEALADALERDRCELAALQCLEVGKPWREADADVAEAVDFCRYYARRALVELAPRAQGCVLGEENTLSYEGRGVCVVIAPWNFPLAILTGMASAALVAGNTVVMKPAEQSSATAWRLHERMLAAGFPPEVVAFLPGIGEHVGPQLVAHRDVAQIAFTGSQSVGLAIVEAAAKTSPGQAQVRRVVCEMGGKNAIVVDDDADLDEAVVGVLRSAFGYAGQKCSACSRAIVVDAVYDAFIARLAAAAAALPVGAAHSPGTTVGPVVDADAQSRLLRATEAAGARKLFVGAAPSGGWFVPPTILAVDDPRHELMQRELFGPVLAVFRARDFAHALEVATDSPFALTGAVFSRSPAHLDEARRRFRVGNLYLNRGSTGALVGRQPFGGFGMSGIGTKAGGPNYLLQFADPRVVTESTLRRGFVPEEM